MPRDPQDRRDPAGNFCGRTRREMLWEAGAGFTGLARPLRSDGTARSYGVMANALYDFDLGPGSFFTPYVGVGAGYVWHEYDGTRVSSPSGTVTIDGSDGRFAYQAIVGAAFPIAILVGPLAGGLITDAWGWRWVFWINIPVGMIALALAVVAVPHIAGRSGRRFDIAGAVVLGVTFGMEIEDTTDPYVVIAEEAINTILAAAVPGAFMGMSSSYRVRGAELTAMQWIMFR